MTVRSSDHYNPNSDRAPSAVWASVRVLGVAGDSGAGRAAVAPAGSGDGAGSQLGSMRCSVWLPSTPNSSTAWRVEAPLGRASRSGVAADGLRAVHQVSFYRHQSLAPALAAFVPCRSAARSSTVEELRRGIGLANSSGIAGSTSLRASLVACPAARCWPVAPMSLSPSAPGPMTLVVKHTAAAAAPQMPAARPRRSSRLR